MAEVPGYFEYPDELTPGTRDNGGWSDNLYDDNGDLVSRATFFPDGEDEDEASECADAPHSSYGLALAVGLAIGAITTFAAVKAAPRVKRWWNDDALPAIRTKWIGFTKASDGVIEDASAEAATLDGVSSANFPGEVDAALEGLPATMSSAEAQQRLLAVLMAAAFIAEQLRRLSNARIENEAGFLELTDAMERLSTQQVTDSINLMLEADCSLLDEQISDQLMKIFGGGRFIEGQYLPLRNEKIKDALRLTDGER